MKKGIELTHGLRVPVLPHTKEVEVQDANEIADLINRKPIMPK